MKKLGKIALAMSLAFCLSVPLFATERQASAAVDKSVLVQDNFNYETLPADVWEATGEGVGLNALDGALQFNGSTFDKVAVWMGNNVTDTESGTPVTGSYTLEAVISRDDTDGSQWLAIYSGLSTCDLNFMTIRNDMEGQYGNAFVFDNGGIGNYTNNGQLIGSKLKITMKSDGTPYYVKMDFVKAETMSENTVTISYAEYDAETGAPAGELKSAGTLTHLSVDGYFGFGATAKAATFSHLKVTQGAEVVYENDFRGDVVDHIYAARPQDKTKAFRFWNQTEGQYANVCKSGPTSSVKVEGGSLAVLAAVPQDVNTVDVLEINYALKPKKIGAKSGIAFGTEGGSNTGRIVIQNTENPAEGDDDAETTTKVYLENAEGETVGQPIDLESDITAQAFRKVKFECRLGGIVKVSYLGKYYGELTGVESFAGRLAFFAETGADIDIDDVSIYKFTSVEDTGRNLATDFSVLNANGKPYLNTTEDWYVSGNVFLQNGRAAFTNAVPGAAFGPRDKYGDFVLKFDVLNITQGVNGGGIEGQMPNPRCSWFGVSFARTDRAQDFLETPMIMFAPRPELGDTRVTRMQLESLNTSFTEGTTVPCQENFFEDGAEDEGKKRINVVIVANNRTITIYYKYESDPDWMLDVPRAVITDLNTYGYVAIVCNYGGNFSISNVSIHNLSASNDVIGDYEYLDESDRESSGTESVGMRAE